MYSAKIMNSHRSPSALRTLIEMQKYYENPPLNKEESFLIKERQENLLKTFQTFQEMNGMQSIQQLNTYDQDSHANGPIMFQNMKEQDASRNNFNFTSASNLNVSLPEVKNQNSTFTRGSPNLSKMTNNIAAASTFHQSQSALRLRNNKPQSPYAKRPDQLE